MSKFRFLSDNVGDQSEDSGEETSENWLPSKEIVPKIISLENCKVNSVSCGEINIKYACSEDVVYNLDEGANSARAECNHSDLITAVYEGGLKIWECTFDLLNFLCEQNVDFNDKRVLDLGCGAGIVGIFSSLKGAYTVFQDYNAEVIESMTVANVALNNIDFKKCAFYCGDWKSFLDLYNKQPSENEKFDYIFTSETIYNTNNYKKILNIFKNLLKKNGIIYLSAKCHYFGVGGGIRHFEDSLKMEDIFNHTTCWVCPNGVKREIIKITLK